MQGLLSQSLTNGLGENKLNKLKSSQFSNKKPKHSKKMFYLKVIPSYITMWLADFVSAGFLSCAIDRYTHLPC